MRPLVLLSLGALLACATAADRACDRSLACQQFDGDHDACVAQLTKCSSQHASAGGACSAVADAIDALLECQATLACDERDEKTFAEKCKAQLEAWAKAVNEAKAAGTCPSCAI